MSTTDSTPLRDVIAIPERAGADDYVLRLTEGVDADHVTRTLDAYVVTDALAEAFDQGLGLVADALQQHTSRGAWLAGSFGSGKSHYMAVLHALLGHHPAARSVPELAPVVAAHDSTLQGKKILRIAVHFLDSVSVEQAVFNAYLAEIGRAHPNAPLPALHQSDQLLADADGLRQRMGDESFFSGLGGDTAGSDDAWGAVLDSQWSATSYAAAKAAPAGSDERQRLVTALVGSYFTSFGRGAEFVGIDEGLAAISAHAKALGYDAVVMFLDELVLWLAFRVRDREFFGREAQKITKFVESGAGIRAIPIVTFIARQLDLSRYFVESGGAVGADQQAIDDAFRHQGGRFSTIVLGDDNLPYVAEKRLLVPVSDEARRTLDDAFEALDKRSEVWDVLLDGVGGSDDGTTSRGADRQAFRRTYPFSPALVSTLRTLASAMQRDRTALKVMQSLLVSQRDRLTVADVIPVGDVFDLVVSGNQAITEDMAGRFRNARSLYADKLRPLLLRENPEDSAAFRTDDRLVKTLVLSAIAPDVPALRELTASRLAALNHGSIVSPLQGQEGSIVLTKLRRWNVEVPEIHISADARNPVVRMKISEVDFESVVEKARGEDNDGRRREVIKHLVQEAFGLADIEPDMHGVSRQVRVWRGSSRTVEVIFANIRDTAWLSDDAFRAGRDTWRFIIDYPFDDDGYAARDDDQRLDDLRNAGLDTRTIAWSPHFLSAKRRDEVGRLAVLEWLLGGNGDRWKDKSSDLAPADRVQAKIILENQRDALRVTLRRALQEAYGAARPTPGTLDLDDAHDRVLRSLTQEVGLQAPVGADLNAAFTNLVDQVFDASFPAHPRFEPDRDEVKVRSLLAVLDAVGAARAEADGRAFVEPGKRDDVRRVANPLGVGHMGETHFVFTAERFPWQNRFAKAMGAAGVDNKDVVTVGTLRSWISAAQPAYGLRTEVADLVICAWAIQEGRAWYRHGAALVPAPRPGALADDIELRPEPLPAIDDWQKAVPRAAAVLGVMSAAFLTGAAVSELAENVRKELGRLSAGARPAADEIEKAYLRLGMSVTGPTADRSRLATAKAAAQLVADLQHRRDNVAVVTRLAQSELPASDQAVGRSLLQSTSVAGQLGSYEWKRLEPLLSAEGGSDDRARAARRVLDKLRSGLASDEMSEPIAGVLSTTMNEVFAWLTDPTPPPPPPPPPRRPQGGGITVRGGDLGPMREALEAFLDEHRDDDVVVEWRIGP